MTEPITLIGAGPVGSLLALLLARRGYAVEVFERRPDMRRESIAAGRSINLALSTRGLHGLSLVGLAERVLAEAVPMRGRRMHAVTGERSFLPYGRDDREHINSMSRGDLNKLLMTEAEATGRVRIHFNQRLVAYDFATRRAQLKDERQGGLHGVDTGVVFGTDGSASALRASLAAASGSEVRSEVLDAGYKELTLPAHSGPGGFGPRGEFALEPDGLHIWPRGSFMLIALPNRDGSFTCTLFLASRARSEAPGFDRLTDAASVQAFFAREFPNALALIPGLAQQFLAAPLGQMVTVRTPTWTRGPALLLGDAAHAIVPFFGQGMNAGFEDCAALDALLAQASARPDWPALFARFAELRKPDTDAIAELALENFIEMRDKVADPRFLLQKAVERELMARLPGEYASRYALVTFTRAPYRVALEAGRVQDALLAEVTDGAQTLEQVDLAKAAALARERLAPVLRRAVEAQWTWG